MPTAVAAPPAAARPDRGRLLLASVLAAVACAALAAHAAVGLSAPLWLDESWTAAFASLPTLPDLVTEMRADNNAPAFYLIVWIWARLFGTSDVALHVPGLLLGCAAPAAAWFGLRARRPRLALVWAAAVALWGPGIVQSGYARPYGLLLLAAVLCCAAFVRLLDAPTRGRAVAWAASGALAMLTHYYAGLLVGLQGAAWLALHRRRALSHWPAALAFLPALGWIAWHLPHLLVYARPDIAWTHRLDLVELPGAAAALVGLPRPELLPAAAALLLLELMVRRGREGGAAGRRGAARIAGGVALAAALLFVALGCARPLYSARYLTAFAPGVLLLISTRLVAASRGRASALAALTAAYAALAASFWAGPAPSAERVYGFETASAWIAEAAPRRLAFFWDNPTTMAETSGQLALVGGTFLHRGGLAVDVAPIVLRPDHDMNGAVLAAADGGRTAALWLWDLNVHGTSARLQPPRLAEARPDLECRDFGAGPIGVYACRPRSNP